MIIILRNYQDTTMHNSLYICQTHFHLLVSILRNIKEKGQNDLLLFAEKNDTILKEKKLVSKIEKSNIFRNVFIIDYTDNNRINTVFRFFKLGYLLNKTPAIKKIHKYKDVYIFNDISTIGKIINIKRIKYILLEDGKGCLNKDHFEKYVSKQNKFKLKIKKIFFGYSVMGESKNIKKIIVDNIDNVQLKRPVEEQNFISLIRGLNKKEQKITTQLFLSKNITSNLNNSVIILTQPFYEDGILKSIDTQIKLFKKIIDSQNEKNIFIKLHPRDKTNYSQIIKKEHIISGDFPIEIINLIPNLKIKKIISISSTSTTSIMNCEEVVTLGWEYLEGLNNEQ